MKTFQVTLSPTCEVIRVKANSLEEVQQSCLNPPVCISEVVGSQEMQEMDKAFEDFSKACDKAIGACRDFIDMDISKTSEPTLETQRD
jgi:hypothetical protein